MEDMCCVPINVSAQDREASERESAQKTELRNVSQKNILVMESVALECSNVAKGVFLNPGELSMDIETAMGNVLEDKVSVMEHVEMDTLLVVYVAGIYRPIIYIWLRSQLGSGYMQV